ncbi:MAG TPA: DUF1361 domain-containing protein [Chitinophagaceae bacterium]|nr:DUF1361 domain-containing protein [Chitinophagaceae bacterium]
MIRNMLLSLKSQKNLLAGSEINRWLAGSMAFSVSFIIARIIYSGNLTFIFLIWNLFLGAIPYFITYYLGKKPHLVNHKWKFPLIFLVWLLFIPNSFYILTDLFHLGQPIVPIWFDLALLISFAWNGLLLGVLSVREMEKYINEKFKLKNEMVFLLPIMFLNALGIYVGRFLRFNSWDVISNPFALASDIIDLLIHPFSHKYPWAMIVCYSLLMSFFYITLKKIGKHIL